MRNGYLNNEMSLCLVYLWKSRFLSTNVHDDIIKWKHFLHYWPFVRGIHRSPVVSPHKSQWRRALVFSLIWAWTNGWANNRDAGDLRCHCAHYDVTVMIWFPKLTPAYSICLLTGPLAGVVAISKSNFQTYFSNLYNEHVQLNHTHVNATGIYLW